MYTGINPINPLAAPGTVTNDGSLAEVNPLPPPGNPVDCSTDHQPLAWGNYPAQLHTFELTFGGTITEGEVWTLTFTPTRMVNGSVQAFALDAITISVTVNATATATALALQFEQAIAAARTITGVSLANLNRIGEILRSATASGAVLTTVGSVGGQTYSVSYTAEAGGTVTGSDTPTVDAEGTDMQIGVAIVKTGLASDGVTPLVRPLQAGDTSSMIIGFVAAANTRSKAIDPDTGYTALYVKSGRSVAYIPLNSGHAQWSVTSDAATVDGNEVWARIPSVASDIAGAVSTPTQTLTITPTVADNTVFSGYIQVSSFGQVVATIPYNFTSDADNTVEESVTALGADVTTAIADYATASGTATYILAAAANYTLTLVNLGAGVLMGVSTGTANHVRVPGVKFSRTNRAGIAALQF